MRWLFAFCGVVAALVVFGGFVRLTRSGLSIVEWKPVTGVVPPIGEQAWRDAFAAYQRGPEFRLVNSSMTLGDFRRIFLIEWLHRLIARLAGLAFLVPFAVFVARGRIPRRDLRPYLAMGSLFVLQAVAGWVMVASGLDSRPSVSHINLSVHLLLAITLFALALWTALDHRSAPLVPRRRSRWSRPSRLAAGFLAVLAVQILYGGFTAGLEAGWVSDTWPLMLGSLVPDTAFGSLGDLVESPITVMWIHRWLAFVVGAMAVVAAAGARERRTDTDVRRGTMAMVVLVGVQIVLGIATVMTSVNIALAMAHQATAIALFGSGVFTLHRLRTLDAATVAAEARLAADDGDGAGDREAVSPSR